MPLLESLFIAPKHSLLATEETCIPCSIQWQACHLMINIAQAANHFSLIKGNPCSLLCANKLQTFLLSAQWSQKSMLGRQWECPLLCESNLPCTSIMMNNAYLFGLLRRATKITICLYNGSQRKGQGS